MNNSIPTNWTTGSPLLEVPSDKADDWYSIKDPSIVRHDRLWHLFVTVRARTRSHALAYYAFDAFENAHATRPIVLPAHVGYWAAPQVFYFRPQEEWYLISQAKNTAWSPSYRAAYSTNAEIGNPDGWSAPEPFDMEWPDGSPYLDFWVICDASTAFLFFTRDNGEMWRAETPLASFPNGFGKPDLVYTGDIFEAGHIYALATGGYLCLIESRLEEDRREYRMLVADDLRSSWREPDDRSWRYATASNLTQRDGHWTDSVSHGELLRLEADERLLVDPAADFFMQGVLHADRKGKPYGEVPWKLGLLKGRHG